jgi:predicted dehydrogenase
MNSGEARRMAEAAEAASVLYGVAQNFRFNQTVHLFRDWIAEGRIGSPRLAHLQFTYPAQTSRRKWIADPTVACGGPIADVGVHCVDALRFIAGADVHSINTVATQDELSGDVEAGAMLQLEMTSGLLANITVSARAPYRTLMEVNGSGGILTAENGLTVDRPVEVQRRNAGELVETATLSNANAYSEMLDAFADCFRTGTPFAATGRDAVHNMQIIDAAYASWRSGKREYIAR